jgi:hypothetical protein
MSIDWSKVRKEQLQAAFRRSLSGEQLSETEHKLVKRRSDIEAFIRDRCRYVTVQAVMHRAMWEVLMRLPEQVWDVLVNDQDLYVFFPERQVSTIHKILINVPTDRRSKSSRHSMTFVVLAQSLNESSHQNAVGTIAHQFALVFLEDSVTASKGHKQAERRAAALASQWGFQEEIAIPAGRFKGG